MLNRTIALTGLSTLAAASYVQGRTRAAARAHPPLGRFVQVGGVDLHYVEAGEGPPLVLLHGLGSMVEDFLISGLVTEASRRYRVIAFDRPGYGHSTRPHGTGWSPLAQAQLLRQALEKLGVHRPILAAHSWGTLVAIAFALEYPGAVRSLALMSGLYFPSLRLDLPMLLPPAIPLVGALLRHTISPLAARLLWPAWLRILFAPGRVPRRFLKEFPTWMALRPTQLRAVAQDGAATLPALVSMGKRYADLRLPVTLVAGRKDRYVQPSHSTRLHALLPYSELLLSPMGGHMVHHMDLPLAMAAIDSAAAGAPFTLA